MYPRRFVKSVSILFHQPVFGVLQSVLLRKCLHAAKAARLNGIQVAFHFSIQSTFVYFWFCDAGPSLVNSSSCACLKQFHEAPCIDLEPILLIRQALRLKWFALDLQLGPQC